jgi:hypothetical protein
MSQGIRWSACYRCLRGPILECFGLNMAVHYDQGVAAAIIRALMSANGILGPLSDFMLISVRLMIEQTLENATGIGAHPWAWPVNEQIIDILHKAVFAFVTGYIMIGGYRGDKLLTGSRGKNDGKSTCSESESDHD